MKIEFSSKKGSTQEISDFIQSELKRKGLEFVTAVEAGEWLDRAGKLKDSKDRPGKPLRDLLRAKKIDGQRQEPNRKGYIDSVK